MAKKSNNGNYGLTVGYPGVEAIEGTLVSYNDTGVFFLSRKSGSSTKLNQFYPMSRVVACYGTMGSEATLYYKTDRMPVFRSGKRGREKPLDVTGVEALGLSAYVTTSTEFPVIIVSGEFANFAGEEKDESAPTRGRKKGETTAAPKGEKKASKPAKKLAKEAKPKGKPVKDDWP